MKKKHKKLPGVTLLELIIVMAIFSGIAVGALAMVRPAMQLHYKTAAQERAVAAVDTMARFIQDNLRYADNMFVYVNHGIKDVEEFQKYPFDYYPFGLDYKCQIGTQSVDDGGNSIFIHSGALDPHHYVNPVSFFAQYYLEESIAFDTATKTRDEINAYFKDKVIYVMEIKNTDEVNVYSYTLYESGKPEIYGANGDDLYGYLIQGDMRYKEENDSRKCSSISNLFSEGKEKINIDKIEIGDDLSKGLNIELSIEYDGATIKNLKLNYNIAVNFMNISNGATLHVNDKYPYDAKRYIFFNWGNVEQMYSSRENPSHKPTKEERAADPGYTYIVYSLPEIIP